MLEIIIIVAIAAVLIILLSKIPQAKLKPLLKVKKPNQKETGSSKEIEDLKEEEKIDEARDKKIEHLLNKAESLFKKKEFKKSEENFIKAIGLDPKNTRAYNGLGIIYLEQNNYKDAENSFREATKLDPENSNFHNNLGLALYNQDSFKKAAEAYKKAAQFEPASAKKWISLGLCYKSCEELLKSQEAFQKAVDIEPNNLEYLHLLVSVLLKLDNFKLAKKYLKIILKLDPENVEAKRELLRLK